MMITSMITPPLIDAIGTSGCFIFFGTCTLSGVFYLHCFAKDSSFAIDKVTGVRVALSDLQKKQLYMPTELREQTKESENIDY